MEVVEEKSYASHGVANTGLALGATALGVGLLQNGLGGILGGNRMPPPPADPLATQRDLTYERELTKANAENGQLKSQLYTKEQLTIVEERLQDKIDAIEDKLNSTTTTQAVINAQQTGIIGVLQNQVMQLNAMTGLYIKQPVMAASEAVLTAFKPNTAATTSTGTGA